MSKKTYCYKNAKECEVIETGFHLEIYPVCRKCKQEISKDLYETIKERQAIQNENKEAVDEDDLGFLYGLTNYHDPFGDT